MPTEFHIGFKKHQTLVTNISLNMNRIKTSVPDGGNMQKDGHYHQAQVLISMQLRTGTIYMEWY